MSKQFVSAQELLEKSFELASKVYSAGFRPTWVIALWRGGVPVGIALQEFFKFHGIRPDHIAAWESSPPPFMFTDSRYSFLSSGPAILLFLQQYVVKNANKDDALLIVDDIFDSGRSLQALLEKLKRKMRANMPDTVRIATVYYKPKNNKTTLVPDFYCECTDKWIVFPHELEDMTPGEILVAKGPKIAGMLRWE